MTEITPIILLIEDNEDDVFAIRRTLKLGQIAHSLHVVTHGQQAIDYLSGTGLYSDRAQHPLPLIIFLDLKLPYADGFEVLAWIHKQPALESVFIVAFTGSAESRDESKGRALGVKSYLIKPPTPEKLIEIFELLRASWGAKPGAIPTPEGPGNPTPPKT